MNFAKFLKNTFFTEHLRATAFAAQLTAFIRLHLDYSNIFYDQVNSFVPNAPFLYHLETLWLSDLFRG